MMDISHPTRPYIDLPDGIDVSGLPTLLDSKSMLDRLNQDLPSGASHFASCRITNLRKKTKTSITICYELSRALNSDESPVQFVYVRAFADNEFLDAVRRASLARWSTTADNLSVTPLADLAAIVYWFPNDERLDGLRRVVVPKKLQRLFYDHFSEYPSGLWRVSDRSIRLQVIRYKPERRAVIRCRFRAQKTDNSVRHERFVFLGLYEQDRLEGLALAVSRICELAATAKQWTVAKLIGIDKDDSLVIWDELCGASLRDALMDSDSDASVDLCAQAIAELHTTDAAGLPDRVSTKSQLVEVESFLTSALPECREVISALARRLNQSNVVNGKNHRSVVHGDLHPGQMIVGESRVGVIDLDRTHCGNPLEDIGNIRAQLWLGPPEGRTYDPESTFTRFMRTYSDRRQVDVDPREIADWTAFSLFRSAVVPLGRFAAQWRQRTRAILREAESCFE